MSRPVQGLHLDYLGVEVNQVSDRLCISLKVPQNIIMLWVEWQVLCKWHVGISHHCSRNVRLQIIVQGTFKFERVVHTAAGCAGAISWVNLRYWDTSGSVSAR